MAKNKKDPWRIGGEVDKNALYAGQTTGMWLGILLYVFIAIALALWIVFSLGCVLAIFQSDKVKCGFSAVNNMLATGGVILTWGAALFDITLQRGVLNAGFWLRPGGGFGEGIQAVWIVLRDLVNIALIGGMVWASINMILKTGQQVGKIVVQIIIVALLVNFSYFFAGVILDASHFASRVIYQEAFGVTIGAPGAKEENKEGLQIATRFMLATRLGSLNDLSLLESTNEEVFVENAQDIGFALLMGLVALLVFMVTAWIFFSVAALFTQRFIVIIILLMTSPVGVLAFSDIPKLKEYGQGWWAALWSQAIFPPILLILFASSFKVLESATAAFVQKDASFLGLFVGPEAEGPLSGATPGQVADGPWGAAWELIIVYIIGIGLMYVSMRIAVNIAKQEPTKIPTTGQIYGQYRKAIKPIAAIPKVIGAIGEKVPAPFWMRTKSGLPYKNIGEALTFAPQRRARKAAPWDVEGQKKAHRYDLRQKKADDGVDEVARANKDIEAATTPEQKAEAEKRKRVALRNLGIALNNMPEEQRNFNLDKRHTPTEAQKRDGITEKDLDNAIDEGEVESANAPRYIDTGEGAGTTAGQPAAQPSSPAVREVVDAVKAADSREAARDALAYRLDSKEGKAILADTQNSSALVRSLREIGSVTLLPPAALAHENIAPNLHLTEVVEIASDTKHVNNEQFDKIANKVSDEVHEAFRAHPASKLRPRQVQRDARPPSPPEMGPGESMARGGNK